MPPDPPRPEWTGRAVERLEQDEPALAGEVDARPGTLFRRPVQHRMRPAVDREADPLRLLERRQARPEDLTLDDEIAGIPVPAPDPPGTAGRGVERQPVDRRRSLEAEMQVDRQARLGSIKRQVEPCGGTVLEPDGLDHGAAAIDRERPRHPALDLGGGLDHAVLEAGGSGHQRRLRPPRGRLVHPEDQRLPRDLQPLAGDEMQVEPGLRARFPQRHVALETAGLSPPVRARHVRTLVRQSKRHVAAVARQAQAGVPAPIPVDPALDPDAAAADDLAIPERLDRTPDVGSPRRAGAGKQPAMRRDRSEPAGIERAILRHSQPARVSAVHGRDHLGHVRLGVGTAQRLRLAVDPSELQRPIALVCGEDRRGMAEREMDQVHRVGFSGSRQDCHLGAQPGCQPAQAGEVAKTGPPPEPGRRAEMDRGRPAGAVAGALRDDAVH